MLDQEAAFVQIQEAKTMVEEDLQRRLEEFEDEKEQLQKMVASVATLEQQLEQASTCTASSSCPGCPGRTHCAGLCWSVPWSAHHRTWRVFTSANIRCRPLLAECHPDYSKPEPGKSIDSWGKQCFHSRVVMLT